MREPLLASPDLDDLPVYDAASVPIGETFGVLAEAASGLVRYFDVSLEGRQRHVLVPVGHARVEKHMGHLRLRLRAATADELDRIPSYEPHTSWTDDRFQNDLLNAFGRLFQGERYYAHPAYDHSGLYAGTHPLLRDPLAPTAPAGLRRISATPGYRVSPEQTDVRGWPVIGSDEARLGRVSDLIIDPVAERVRYLVVRRELDETETLLPVGYVESGTERLRAPLTPADITELPGFAADTLERDQEARLRAVLDGRLAGGRRYARPDFRGVAA